MVTAGLELGGGLLPVRGQVLAVAAPRGVELHQPEMKKCVASTIMIIVLVAVRTNGRRTRARGR